MELDRAATATVLSGRAIQRVERGWRLALGTVPAAVVQAGSTRRVIAVREPTKVDVFFMGVFSTLIVVYIALWTTGNLDR
jgi:hypothetical protein